MLSFNNGNQENCPLHKCWSNIFLLKDDLTHEKKKYISGKLVKACLSCFHGPSG